MIKATNNLAGGAPRADRTGRTSVGEDVDRAVQRRRTETRGEDR